MPPQSIAEPRHEVERPARLRAGGAWSLDELDAIEPAWRELGAMVREPQLQFAWVRAWFATLGVDAAPHIATAWRGKRLAALAPLVKRRLGGVRRLFLATAGDLFEPMDFLAADERALTRVATSLARCGTPLVLERIGADSPAVRQLRSTYRFRAITITRPQASCPFIELDESWLDPESHLNSGRRSDLRRARRKAEQLGQVTTEIHTPDLDDLAALVDTALAVEASSWKGETGTALAHDALRALFYRQYFEAACTEGILRICFLRIGDRVAAMQLAVEQGGGFWLLKVGYDARFSACSPGILLMRDTIRYAAEAGLRRYEFLGRAEAWTRVWTPTERPCISLRVYPLGIRGLAALASDVISKLHQRRQTAKPKLPPAV